MSKVIKLDSVRRTRIKERANGLTMCQSGFHKWKPVIGDRFDVKQGRLLTTERCKHCLKERTILK